MLRGALAIAHDMSNAFYSRLTRFGKVLILLFGNAIRLAASFQLCFGLYSVLAESYACFTTYSSRHFFTDLWACPMAGTLWTLVTFPWIWNDDGTIPLHVYMLFLTTASVAAVWSMICRRRCEAGKGLLF